MTVTFPISSRNIKLKENVENNVVELRGLWVNLNPNKDEKKQFRRVDDPNKVEYGNHTDLQWEKPLLDCWHAKGTNCPFTKKQQ